MRTDKIVTAPLKQIHTIIHELLLSRDLLWLLPEKTYIYKLTLIIQKFIQILNNDTKILITFVSSNLPIKAARVAIIKISIRRYL